MTPLRVTRAWHMARAWAEVGGPSGHLCPPKAPATPTQDAGVCEGALAGVEAVGAQVGRHHLLDQRLQAQVVLGHAARLVHALQEGGRRVTHSRLGRSPRARPTATSNTLPSSQPLELRPQALSCSEPLCSVPGSCGSGRPWCPGEKDPVVACRRASCSPPLGGSPSRLPGGSGRPTGQAHSPGPSSLPARGALQAGKAAPWARPGPHPRPVHWTAARPLRAPPVPPARVSASAFLAPPGISSSGFIRAKA